MTITHTPSPHPLPTVPTVPTVGEPAPQPESCAACETRPPVASIRFPDNAVALLCGICLDDALDLGLVELTTSTYALTVPAPLPSRSHT